MESKSLNGQISQHKSEATDEDMASDHERETLADTADPSENEREPKLSKSQKKREKKKNKKK